MDVLCLANKVCVRCVVWMHFVWLTSDMCCFCLQRSGYTHKLDTIPEVWTQITPSSYVAYVDFFFRRIITIIRWKIEQEYIYKIRIKYVGISLLWGQVFEPCLHRVNRVLFTMVIGCRFVNESWSKGVRTQYIIVKL